MLREIELHPGAGSLYEFEVGRIVSMLRASVEPEKVFDISLADFIRESWSVLEPDTVYQPNWHIEYLSEWLEMVTRGDVTRLIINIAPRHMKSILVSVMWPCWEWVTKPSTRWMFASYNGDLALKHSVDRRLLLRSDWYQDKFPGAVQFVPDANQKSGFSNMRRGSMVAVAFGGRATGLGGNRLVIDDPLNPAQADSILERQSSVDFFTQTLSTRLDQPSSDAIVIVMQRLHEMDLTGYLADAGFTVVSIPSIATHDEELVFPVTGRRMLRKEGDLLWPSRITPEVIHNAEVTMGPFGFASQHQQSPVPVTGGVVKDEYWRFYSAATAEVIPRVADEVVVFADTATKTGEQNDWSVLATWALVTRENTVVPAGFYLLDIWRDRVEFPELVNAAVSVFRRLPETSLLVVEDKSSGQQLIQQLQRTTLPVIGWSAAADKVQRLVIKAGYLEAGMVHLPEAHPLLTAFLDEHRWFPKAEHDDMVDTTTMMLHRFSAAVEGGGWDTYAEGEMYDLFRNAGVGL